MFENILVPNGHLLARAMQFPLKLQEAIFNIYNAYFLYWQGLGRHTQDFTNQLNLAGELFCQVEREKVLRGDPPTLQDCIKLLKCNHQMFAEGAMSSAFAILNFHNKQVTELCVALANSFIGEEGTGIKAFSDQQKELMAKMATFEEEIKAIRPQYGFHFDDGNYRLIEQTERFWLYQVLPFVEGESRPELVKNELKPIVIIPPYVLGANILCFLRNLGKSYVHSFTNQGIPTYIRIMKPIELPAVQAMTQEDDCLDTKLFCEKVKKIHQMKVTLNGYCQGGYGAICNSLSGMLDEFVDAVMTCVAPMDGTRSLGLKAFLDNLPNRYNNLDYGYVSGGNGNRLASGQLMSFVYKLKSIGNQAPIVCFYNDLGMVLKSVIEKKRLSPTVFALNYWLLHERVNIPAAITQVSFDSYNIPITSDGTLPVKLFGRSLNLGRLKEKGIKYLIFYAEHDDLVEPDVALAAQEYADIIEILHGGHVKAATSPDPKNPDGPVQTHLGLK